MSSPLDEFDREMLERASNERVRQLLVEGWTRDHDDSHTDDEMARAAACYAEPPWSREGPDCGPTGLEGTPSDWPWDPRWWKPDADRLREIDKALALLLAEGARLLRTARARRMA